MRGFRDRRGAHGRREAGAGQLGWLAACWQGRRRRVRDVRAIAAAGLRAEALQTSIGRALAGARPRSGTLLAAPGRACCCSGDAAAERR